MPESERKQAFQFRLSPKFRELNTETAFQHAVYRSENPEIARLFLIAAGEKTLDSKLVQVSYYSMTHLPHYPTLLPHMISLLMLGNQGW